MNRSVLASSAAAAMQLDPSRLTNAQFQHLYRLRWWAKQHRAELLYKALDAKCQCARKARAA